MSTSAAPAITEAPVGDVPEEVEHPAAALEGDVAEVAGSARRAAYALGAVAAAYHADVATRVWNLVAIHMHRSAAPADQADSHARLESAVRYVDTVGVVIVIATLVTAYLFLQWTRRLVALTRALGGRDMRWRPRDVFWAYALPFVGFVRPYQMLRDVQARIAPEGIAPPAPRADRECAPEVATGYRDVALVVPPLAKPVPASLLGVWWALFCATSVIPLVNAVNRLDMRTLDDAASVVRFDLLVSLLGIAAAVLAIRVVRSLTLRLEERFRRIRYSTPAALSAQGIRIAED